MVASIYPSTRDEKARTYLVVMEEVRSRFQAIDVAVNSPLHPILIREICYLELRHICELVAIGCLIAQGDFKSYRTFREAYSPIPIFKHLESLHESFFPQPVDRSEKDRNVHLEFNEKPNAITRKELEKLWQQSGDHLHRLSASKFFKPKDIDPDIIGKIINIKQKMVELLDNHGISIPSPKVMLVVSLSQPDCRVIAHFLNYLPDGKMTVEEFKLE